MTTNRQQQLDSFNFESAVLERYQAGARQPKASLCCPTDYEGNYLAILPQEIIEKDTAAVIPLAMSQQEKPSLI